MKILFELSSEQNDPPDRMDKATEITRHITEIGFKLEHLEVLSDTEELRLQIAMDRLSKIMETLSNMLKR